MPSSALIIGCGYVGRELALGLLRDGWDVTGWTQTENTAGPLRAAGLRMIAADAADARSWSCAPHDFSLGILCAATRGGNAEAYRTVYHHAMTRLVAHASPSAHLVFASSTSVYAQDDGSWVNEDSDAAPSNPTARVLLDAERVCLARGGAVARIAGIYGPGRSGPIRLLRSGQAHIGPDGGRWLNQIHRDDVASALRFLGERRAIGVFNASDNEPVRQADFYHWLAPRLGLPVPTPGPETVSRRGPTNKRISNERLRSLGWTPRFPSFREGYADAIGHPDPLPNARGAPRTGPS